jgi:glutathione synthase/RimK-type ligase-like ATP-grasp enzyme
VVKSIAIINSVAGISSKELAEFLKEPGVVVDVSKPFKTKRRDYNEFDVVFNYGCSAPVVCRRIVNKPSAVKACVDKPTTFEAFKRAGVDTVEHVTKLADVPMHWDWVVVRKQRDGRKAEDLAYYENIPGAIPEGELYSEYFEHKYEYRVVVFMGKVVGFYYKQRDKNDVWSFMIQPRKGFEKMGEQCIAAAKALDIDYVGFDVVANTKNNFKILEANSCPVLTAESMEAIHQFIYNT